MTFSPIKSILFAVPLLVLTSLADAQAPGANATPSNFRPTSSLSFQVRAVANGGASAVKQSATSLSPGNSQTATASSGTTRTRNSQTSLELTVRNLAAVPASGEFEYYFIAQDAARPRPFIPFIYSKGTKPLTIGPGQEVKEIFQSAELVQQNSVRTEVQRITPASGQQGAYDQYATRSEKFGYRPVGWIVRLMVDGKLVRVQASSSEYAKAGESEQDLTKMENSLPAPRPGQGFAPGQKPGVPPVPGIPQR